METIIIKLNPAKMENPDLDIRYVLPDRIEEYTHNEVTDNGYDYLTNQELGIWLATKNAKEAFSSIMELIKAFGLWYSGMVFVTFQLLLLPG